MELGRQVFKCTKCGKIDETYTATCSNCGNVPHRIITINGVRNVIVVCNRCSICYKRNKCLDYDKNKDIVNPICFLHKPIVKSGVYIGKSKKKFEHKVSKKEEIHLLKITPFVLVDDEE